MYMHILLYKVMWLTEHVHEELTLILEFNRSKGRYCETSLVPRPSITANVVEGLVKLLHRMTSGVYLEAWHFRWTAVLVHERHNKPRLQTPSDAILHRGFAMRVIEGLGTRLAGCYGYVPVSRFALFPVLLEDCSQYQFALCYPKKFLAAVKKLSSLLLSPL